jgi:hypothetical protein
VTDFQSAVVSLLRREYPQALIVTEEITAGMQKPCLQVMLDGVTLRKEMGRRWRREEKLLVYWYPPDGAEPQDEETALQLLLRQSARGVSTAVEREKSRLKIGVSLAQILFMNEQEAERMKQLILRLGEQEKSD